MSNSQPTSIQSIGRVVGVSGQGEDVAPLCIGFLSPAVVAFRWSGSQGIGVLMPRYEGQAAQFKGFGDRVGLMECLDVSGKTLASVQVLRAADGSIVARSRELDCCRLSSGLWVVDERKTPIRLFVQQKGNPAELKDLRLRAYGGVETAPDAMSTGETKIFMVPTHFEGALVARYGARSEMTVLQCSKLGRTDGQFNFASELPFNVTSRSSQGALHVDISAKTTSAHTPYIR